MVKANAEDEEVALLVRAIAVVKEVAKAV